MLRRRQHKCLTPLSPHPLPLLLPELSGRQRPNTPAAAAAAESSSSDVIHNLLFSNYASLTKTRRQMDASSSSTTTCRNKNKIKPRSKAISDSQSETQDGNGHKNIKDINDDNLAGVEKEGEFECSSINSDENENRISCFVNEISPWETASQKTHTFKCRTKYG